MSVNNLMILLYRFGFETAEVEAMMQSNTLPPVELKPFKEVEENNSNFVSQGGAMSNRQELMYHIRDEWQKSGNPVYQHRASRLTKLLDSMFQNHCNNCQHKENGRGKHCKHYIVSPMHDCEQFKAF